MRTGLHAFYLITFLGLSVASFVDSYLQKSRWTNPALVHTGSAEYIDGPSRSTDFVDCSAVILDYGDKGFFAHALPGTDLPGSDVDDEWVYRSEVVSKLLKDSKARGLDPRDGEAVLVTGSRKETRKILAGLRESGVRIRSCRLYESGLNSRYWSPISRDVDFDPVTDMLFVEPHANDPRTFSVVDCSSL